MVVYFILHFMLELVFFFLNKSLKLWPGRYSSQNLWRQINTFHDKRSGAAGRSKMVSGHTCVPASIRLGDVGDA